MSQFAEFSGSPAPDGVRPTRSTADYVDSLAVRLRRLAAGRSTGILPLSGLSDGAIYLHAGLVVGAESSRTPPDGQDRGLLTPLLRVEPAIDAVLDLVLSQSAIGRFRAGKGRGGPDDISVPAESLVGEIARRLHLVRQMAAVVSADTPVYRSPKLHSARVQVSALQWALLIRSGTATTPRALAWALGRSVFGTTTDVYRLMAQHLLLAADQSGRAPDPTQRDPLSPPETCPGTISFLRAVSDEKGENHMPPLSDMLNHAAGGG
jgi:hypothetical protein